MLLAGKLLVTPQRQRRREQGLCTYCRHDAEVGDVCIAHWFMRLAKRLLGRSTMANAQALKASFVASRALCAYTGEELTFRTARGVHRLPIDQGGTRTVENIAWTTNAVAAMKGDLTDDEFCALCAQVAARGAR
jgi:hypothetical protein